MFHFERLFVNTLRTEDRIYDAQREDSSLLSGIAAQRARHFIGSFVALTFIRILSSGVFLIFNISSGREK